MQKNTKQIIIYGAFGLLLGAKIVEVLFIGGAGLLDWWLLLMGAAAAIVHYLPEKADASSTAQEQGWSAESSTDSPLVLRDYPDTQRGRTPTAYPEGHREQLVRR